MVQGRKATAVERARIKVWRKNDHGCEVRWVLGGVAVLREEEVFCTSWAGGTQDKMGMVSREKRAGAGGKGRRCGRSFGAPGGCGAEGRWAGIKGLQGSREVGVCWMGISHWEQSCV